MLEDNDDDKHEHKDGERERGPEGEETFSLGGRRRLFLFRMRTVERVR